jgi:hypothetical protein
MAEINCPCGARVTATPTLNGWKTELGSSYHRHCSELRDELKEHGKVSLNDFSCKILDKLVLAKMGDSR